ncbi:hypothetical protein GCM10011499_21240 [Pelagibacterium lentulum]|uniref:Uncharacterized protein n=1 Tax=Pelagibacterium lentulum TaxID=2029865 RepID=A0A916RC98_9HYPH|nr:hypothetical protein GCM10011499_21240 [Pelagibacterium lentulum]
MICHDAHGLAGVTIKAGWTVNQILTATKAMIGKQLMERSRSAATQMGKELALLPTVKVGAGQRSGQKELGAFRCVVHLLLKSFTALPCWNSTLELYRAQRNQARNSDHVPIVGR